MPVAHPDLHPRPRRAARLGPPVRRQGARPERRRVGRGGVLPGLGVPSLRRARVPRPPLPGALGRLRRRPGLGDRVRRGAVPLRLRLAVPMALSVQTDMCTPALGRVRHRRPARALPPARRSPARRSGPSRSPSPTPGRTSPASPPGPSATATPGSSTAGRCSSPTGIRADFLTWWCRPTPARGTAASRLFLVDTDLPGVSVSRKLKKLGMRSSDTAEIALDDVAVPHANLIGLEPGQGFAQLMWQLQYERLSSAAGLDRRMPRRSLEQTIALRARAQVVREARSRDHQVIAHKLADAATELEAARALVYEVVWRIHAGRVPRRRDLDGEEVRGRRSRTALSTRASRCTAAPATWTSTPSAARTATPASSASAPAPTRS